MSLVGYSRDKSREVDLKARLTTWDLSAAGAVSGAGTRLIFQPLDVCKIRLQLQVETRGNVDRKYRGMTHLLCTMLREEGVGSLWKGHVPAQLLSITYGLSSFLAFETATKFIYQSGISLGKDPKYKPVSHFISGSIGGCFGTLTSFPFDVLRTRIVAQPESSKVYSSVADAIKKLYTEAGIRGFFKGFVPTVMSIAPQTGLQFGFYTFFNQMLDVLVVKQESSGQRKMTMLGSLSCGGLAGLCAKLAVYPLDTVKKRLQISGWSLGRSGLGVTASYLGTRHCLGEILKKEGLAGLYKGVGPALVKSVLTTSSHFWLYENVCYLLALRHLKKEDDSSDTLKR